jgi:hypothetical protein
MPGSSEWGDVALSCSREQFVAVYRHPFLYSTRRQVKPARPMRTERFETTGLIRLDAAVREELENPLVYPVTKVQTAFPSMITVGRTQNNDIVIDDVLVSKFHAFFRAAANGLEVGDAGSSNGTKVRGEALEKRGPALAVRSGDLLTFGPLDFLFLSPAACWDRLVSDLDNWGD